MAPRTLKPYLYIAAMSSPLPVGSAWLLWLGSPSRSIGFTQALILFGMVPASLLILIIALSSGPMTSFRAVIAFCLAVLSVLWLVSFFLLFILPVVLLFLGPPTILFVAIALILVGRTPQRLRP